METIDQTLFFFFNHTLHNRLLDEVMPYWRSMYLWLPVYVFLIAYLVLNFRKNGWVLIIAAVLTVGVADQMSSNLIKKTVKRIRPCNDEAIKSQVQLIVRCGSGYSFTSSHATNHFTLAIFLIFTVFKNNKTLKIIALVWATSIALGQVYVGVHYPSDILGGAVVGILIGFSGAWLYQKWLSRPNSAFQLVVL